MRLPSNLTAHQTIAIGRITRDKALDLYGRTAAVARIIGQDRVSIDDKDVAAEAKRLLKVAFPGVKFSATSKPVYGITVRWTDGPSLEKVEKALRKINHQNNDSDVWSDYYQNWTRIAVDGVSIRHGLVRCERETSKETTAAAIAWARKHLHPEALRYVGSWGAGVNVYDQVTGERFTLLPDAVAKIHRAGIPL